MSACGIYCLGDGELSYCERMELALYFIKNGRSLNGLGGHWLFCDCSVDVQEGFWFESEFRQAAVDFIGSDDR